MTDASSRSILAPLSSPLNLSVLRPADAFAPRARNPAKCVSSLRCPIWSPPGGGSEARPTRASSGPAKRKLVLVLDAREASILAVRIFGVAIVTVPPLASRTTLAPNVFAASSIAETSAMSGTFLSVTGSDESSVAAIIGRAAFLFPDTRCVPETVLPPWITNLLTTARRSALSRRTRRACRRRQACRTAGARLPNGRRRNHRPPCVCRGR